MKRWDAFRSFFEKGNKAMVELDGNKISWALELQVRTGRKREIKKIYTVYIYLFFWFSTLNGNFFLLLGVHHKPLSSLCILSIYTSTFVSPLDSWFYWIFVSCCCWQLNQAQLNLFANPFTFLDLDISIRITWLNYKSRSLFELRFYYSLFILVSWITNTFTSTSSFSVHHLSLPTF